MLDEVFILSVKFGEKSKEKYKIKQKTFHEGRYSKQIAAAFSLVV